MVRDRSRRCLVRPAACAQSSLACSGVMPSGVMPTGIIRPGVSRSADRRSIVRRSGLTSSGVRRFGILPGRPESQSAAFTDRVAPSSLLGTWRKPQPSRGRPGFLGVRLREPLRRWFPLGRREFPHVTWPIQARRRVTGLVLNRAVPARRRVGPRRAAAQRRSQVRRQPRRSPQRLWHVVLRLVLGREPWRSFRDQRDLPLPRGRLERRIGFAGRADVLVSRPGERAGPGSLVASGQHPGHHRDLD
ncbi:MAG: hypothetical protein ABSA93_16590 [Streptosporangiaceae bacterium]